MDIRAAAAREAHRLAEEAEALAAQHRENRNRNVKALRADGWTYSRIAAETDLTPELVAAIVKGRTGRTS